MNETSNDLVRYKILEILYGKAKRTGTDWIVKRTEIKKLLPFDEKQIDFNLFYLHERDLAKIMRVANYTWDTATITAKGIDVIEHKQKFVEELPFIQLAIQEINAPIYGSAIQTFNSQVNFYQQVTDSFKQAYKLLEAKKDVTPEEKEEIKKKLTILEEELKKKDKDAGKIQRLWKWIKQNANWLVPMVPSLTQLILEGIKLALGE
jgi:hypothetical protein